MSFIVTDIGTPNEKLQRERERERERERGRQAGGWKREITKKRKKIIRNKQKKGKNSKKGVSYEKKD